MSKVLAEETGCVKGVCNGFGGYTVGTYIYTNGDTYVGEWGPDRARYREEGYGSKHGKGVYTYADGTTVEGIWSNDKIKIQCMEGNCVDGKGLINDKVDGMVYFGGLKDYKPHGEGVLTEPDGFKHTGEFKNNKRDGIGTSEYKNGAKYTGGFKDDKFHGQGTITYKGGDKQTGNFLNGKKDGVHKIILSDGTEYKKLYQYGKIEEYIFENNSHKQKWLEKITKKNKIKENAELKCVDSVNDAFNLKFDKKKNQIFFEIGEVEIDNVYVNFDMVLNYILRNNDRTIIAFGSKSFTKNGITKSLIFRIELDKYTGDLLFSYDELGEKGFEVAKIFNADSYNFRKKDKSICKKRILN